MHEQLGQIHHVESPPAHHRSRPGHQAAGGQRDPRAGPTRGRRTVVPMGNYVTNQGRNYVTDTRPHLGNYMTADTTHPLKNGRFEPSPGTSTKMITRARSRWSAAWTGRRRPPQRIRATRPDG